MYIYRFFKSLLGTLSLCNDNIRANGINIQKSQALRTCRQHSSSADRVSTLYTSTVSGFSGLSHCSDIRLLVRSVTVGLLRTGPGTSGKRMKTE